MTPFFRNFFICYCWEHTKCKINVETCTNPFIPGCREGNWWTPEWQCTVQHTRWPQACTGELLWHMGLSGFQGLSTCSSQKHQGWIEPIFFTIFSVVVFKHNFIISLNQCLPSSKLRQPKLCLLINFYHAVNIGLYKG